MRIIPLLALAAVHTAQAAVFTLDLSGLPSQSALDGVRGWVQSESNFVDGEVYPRAFVHPIGATSGVALGGYYDSEPAAAPSGITITQYPVLLGLSESRMELNFAIQDSITTYADAFPGDVDRNRFSIGYVNSAGTELFSLVFVPNSQSTDPSAELSATWNMHWSTGGVMSATAFGAVFEGSQTLGGLYAMTVVTKASAIPGGVDFQLSVAGGGATASTSGLLAGSSADQIAGIQLGWRESGTEVGGLGSNFLAVSGITYGVPEPSGLMLCLVSVLPFVLRRKRLGV
jgi:hypothetical protein